MPDPTPVRGSSAVLSIRPFEIVQGIVLHDPHPNLLARRTCEIIRLADGEVHEVTFGLTLREDRSTVRLTALPRRDAAPRLAVGDVVRWELAPAEPNRRFVNAAALWWLFQCRDRLVPINADLPKHIVQWLDGANAWARSPWYDDGVSHLVGAILGGSILQLFAPLVGRKDEERRGAVAGAVYLEAARRVLLTVDDVRQGRVPVYHQRILTMIERWDPLARLGKKDRDDARPLARALEGLVLQAALVRPPGLGGGLSDASPSAGPR